jgi:hypothetical protein
MMNLDFSQVLWEWVYRLPHMLVCVAGIILAFIRREQHPRVSFLVMGACVLGIMMSLFMSVIINTALRLMPFEMMRNGVILFHSVLGSVPYAILLWAVFMDRRKDGH